MKSPTIEGLLLLLCLPTASWASHVTFNPVRETSALNSAAVTPLASAFRGRSDSSHDIALRLNGGSIPAAALTVYDCSYICVDAHPAGSRLPDGMEEPVAWPGPTVYLSRGNLTKMPDPRSDSRLSAGATLVRAVPFQSTSLSPGSGIAYIARIIDGNDPVAEQLVRRGVYSAQPLTAFLIGFIWLTPTLLHHRVTLPRPHGRRRSSHPRPGAAIT